MKAIAIQTFGSPDGLALIDLPTPAPGPGQVLITAEAIGVGGVDAMIRRGTVQGFGFTEGHVPGSEVAGVVAAVGDGVDPSWVGRRVWAFTGTGGAYAEAAIASAEEILPIPEDLPAADAVTLGSSGPVAHYALAHARFAPGDSVLVRGAAGSIGILAVQLAAQGGASAVAVTTSSASRGERLRALGATEVLDRAGEGGRPEYDVVIDIIAGPDLPAFIGRLAPNGRMVVVGAIAGFPPADFGAAMLPKFRQSISVGLFSADTVSASDRHAVREKQFAAAVRGELRSVVHEVLPLTEAALAHRKMDDGEVFGRIVLTP
ncbi:zinc-binding dehydrogenase [Cryptosporangium japonicum]|uniref:Zinc-binding dehydrogenase n=1 Tax=Cryptosporangium japonicum TaxID=80872 RepID=A0ABP3DY47_9ACTN